MLHDLSRRKEIGDEMQTLSLHILRHYFPDHAPSAALLREIGHIFRTKATEVGHKLNPLYGINFC